MMRFLLFSHRCPWPPAAMRILDASGCDGERARTGLVLSRLPAYGQAGAVPNVGAETGRGLGGWRRPRAVRPAVHAETPNSWVTTALDFPYANGSEACRRRRSNHSRSPQVSRYSAIRETADRFMPRIITPQLSPTTAKLRRAPHFAPDGAETQSAAVGWPLLAPRKSASPRVLTDRCASRSLPDGFPYLGFAVL